MKHLVVTPPLRFISCHWAVITKRDREIFGHISLSNNHVFLRITKLEWKGLRRRSRRRCEDNIKLVFKK